MFCGLTRNFVTYWARERLPKSASCLSVHSLLSAHSLKLKVMCTCFHSPPLASRPGKNNSEGFCKITASGYREIVLICQNISAYIIAFFFSPSELVPVESMCLGPLLIFLFTETNVSRTPFAIPLGGKDNFWASKSFSYTWINMTLCF